MRKNVGVIVLLGLYTYYYLVMELAVNDYAGHVIGSENVSVLYGLCYLAVALGYPLYYATRRLVRNTAALRTVSIAVVVVAAVSFSLLSLTRSAELLVACSLLAHGCSGYIGGIVYARAAMGLQSARNIGRTVGIAYAGATAVQMAGIAILSFFPVLDGQWTERIVIVCVLVAIAWLVTRNDPPAVLSGAVVKTPSTIRTYILGGVAAIALIALLQGVNDGIATTLHAGDGDFVVHGYVRLFMIPGVLIAGAIADLRDRRFFPYATLLAMIIMTAAVLLFSDPGTYNTAVIFVYFFGSFMSIYSIVPFLQWAPSTSAPELVAVAGRSVRYACAGVAIMISSSLFASASMTVLIIVYIVLLALLFTTFFFMGQLRLPSRQHSFVPTSSQAFALRYSLTDREAEILALLDDGLATAHIAEKLFVSEKTVRNHISNMLAKTGQPSRIELLELARRAHEEYKA